MSPRRVGLQEALEERKKGQRGGAPEFFERRKFARERFVSCKRRKKELLLMGMVLIKEIL